MGLHLFDIFTRYFRKLLENGFNLFQRSLQQWFLVSCDIHAWSGFKASIFVGFFISTLTVVNENCCCSRFQRKQNRLFLCMYQVEMEFLYFQNLKSVLLTSKYKSPYGDNAKEYLKSRMLLIIWDMWFLYIQRLDLIHIH